MRRLALPKNARDQVWIWYLTGTAVLTGLYLFAPALAGSLVAGIFDLDRVAGGAGIALLMSGLALIVAAGDLVQVRLCALGCGHLA